MPGVAAEAAGRVPLGQDAVARDGDVHHGERRAEPAREVVRPPVVGVGRRPRAVGDRIAERGDGAGTARGRHFNARTAGTTSA